MPRKPTAKRPPDRLDSGVPPQVRTNHDRIAAAAFERVLHALDKPNFRGLPKRRADLETDRAYLQGQLDGLAAARLTVEDLISSLQLPPEP